MRKQEEILEIAKQEADIWLEAIKFVDGIRDSDGVLKELQKRTFNNEPVVARVADSPETVLAALMDGAKEILKTDNEAILKDAIKDAHKCKWDYYYIAFYESSFKAAGLKNDFIDQSLLPAVRLGMGYIINMGGLIVGVMLPKQAHKDEDGRIHHQTGPAIEWGNSKQYWWHGVQVDESWILNPDGIDPVAVLDETNAEKRRAGCEIMGWSKILNQLDAKTINVDKDPTIGTLYEVDLPDAPGSKFIKVICGTGRDFVLPVPEEMKTAIEAQKWMWQMESEDVVRLASKIRT